jgi:DNA polymerase I-like protein with 3'-5' exonuclease and polymerase domains
MRPLDGFSLAYIDWSQQEFGIAAALSGDSSMIEAYLSGDPYLTFAKQAGAVPGDATKQSHKAERELFKQCALAVQYGMQERSLSERLGKPVIVGRQLLQQHRRTYPKFWEWSEAAVNRSLQGFPLPTTFGWTIHPTSDPNPRSVANFPVQANGAEMMRWAAILATERGICVCAPSHDAFLIEAPTAQIETVAAEMQDVMQTASQIVLGGLKLRSDVEYVHSPDRYMDERGIEMWNCVMELLDELALLEQPSDQTAQPCAETAQQCAESAHQCAENDAQK